MKPAAPSYASLHAVPFPYLVATGIVSLMIVSLCWLGWAVWLVALCVIAAWLPLIFSITKSLHRKYGNVGFIFLLVVAQTLHFIEHVVIMIQLHIYRLPIAQANGIISPLNVEWVHFIWASWVLAFAIWFVFLFPQNKWLTWLFFASIWHEIEHMFIMATYLKTGISGTPGLLARGGALWGGLPISRPDLHFIYVTIQQVLLVLAYREEMRKAV